MSKELKLMERFGNQWGVEPAKALDTIKATVMPSGKRVSNEELMAFLVVADRYKLDPLMKEIYAFPDKGGVIPIVGIDGWMAIMNRQPEFDGIDYEYTDDSVTAIIYRKDRSHPTKVTEFLGECKRNTPAWNSHPRRMLRHRATSQAIRTAFGISGIMERDEAEAHVERDITPKAQPDNAVDITALVKPAEPDAPTYAQIADMINNAQSREESKAALDMAINLPEDQVQELVENHLAKWQIAEDTQA